MVAKVQLVFQLALGLVFLFSTTGKLRDATGFSRGIAEYKIVPSVLVHPVALLVILAEACLALTHLTGLLLGLAAPFGFFMLIGFAAAVGVNLRRGRTLSCHCFGTADGETISRRTLARLLMLL